MKAPVRRFRDDSNSRIGTYEAFLDLLTLFCFILIFAAAMYVAQPASNVAQPASTGPAKSPLKMQHVARCLACCRRRRWSSNFPGMAR